MTKTEELERLMAGATRGELQATPCPCGHKACRTFQLNRGTFYQGSGFSIADAALIVAAVNALPELLALRKAASELADASELLLNQGEDGGYTEHAATAVAIGIEQVRAALNQEPGQ